MSFYDTIRCLYYDPAYVIRTHGDDILGTVAVIGVLFAMFAW